MARFRDKVDQDSDDTVSVYDAADVRLSHGVDEDYTLECSEVELRRVGGL